MGEAFVARRSVLAPRTCTPHNCARSVWADFPQIQAIFTHADGLMPTPCMTANPAPRPGVTPRPNGPPLQVVGPARHSLPSRRRIALLPDGSSVTVLGGGAASGGGWMNTRMVIIGGGHHSVSQLVMRGLSRRPSGRSTRPSLPLPTVQFTWKRGDSGRPCEMSNTLGMRANAPATQPVGHRVPLCKIRTTIKRLKRIMP
jgi:hypothetical protein